MLLDKRELPKRDIEPLATVPESVYVDGLIDGLPPYTIYEPDNYCDGPEGFIKWCEDNCSLPVYPEGSDIAVWMAIRDLPKEPHPQTGKSYWDMWERQKAVVRQCLRMRNGRFIYRLVILCWMRGEGKSLLACLLQLWKFFNWTRQNIVLGANSKEQTTFVHFDVMRDIILNSPALLEIVGKKNILEKRIRLLDASNNETCTIRAISSFTGIVSNITGYTFSEMFDMKNPKFFTQLDGSIRNIPNAFGVIDSTVSEKSHILYKMFTSFVRKEVRTVYFSYRMSREGMHTDYWNPHMSQEQLDDYKAKFLPNEYERYFLNLWSAGTDKIYTKEMLDAAAILGADGKIGNAGTVLELVTERCEIQQKMEDMVSEGTPPSQLTPLTVQIEKINSRLTPLESVYSLRDFTKSKMASLDDLLKLGDLFDTDWAVMGGIDRADPMKGTMRGARTIFTCIAKGLRNSRSTPFQITPEGTNPQYIYFLLHLAHVESSSLEDLKEVILACHNEYAGMDKLGGDRWGIWDLEKWCEEQTIAFEAIFPTYERQRLSFTELYHALKTGRFKFPPLAVWGSKEQDILREEALLFQHDPDKKWFGSPEKDEKHGTQDDAIYSTALCVYGGRDLSVEDFRKRSGAMSFGDFMGSRDMSANY